MHQWNVYETFTAAAHAAAEFLATTIRDSLQQRGTCHVILSGGSTPPPCLTQLLRHDLPWEKIHWYPGDERCVARGHLDRNDVMLEKYLWSQLGETNIHVIPAELGAEAAATAYSEIIRDVERFDVAFLGMGEDGHTASLFPNNAALKDTRRIVPVYNSPKPPMQRVSFGMETLRLTRQRMVLAGGPAKAEVITRIRAGESLPINCLGDIHWYIDAAANAGLASEI